jgi:AcrR family transcriptional regulator
MDAFSDLPADVRELEAQEDPSRFERRLEDVLAHATDVFWEKGYAAASMRDLSRKSGMSLAGLYHYVGSKERLLFMIQKRTFWTILSNIKQRLVTVSDAESRIRVFIQNHLEYFLANQKAMKVLSHEDDVLRGDHAEEIAGIKREYYRTCAELLNQLKLERKLEFTSRTAVLTLFGMMNWIYTWYKADDGDADKLAREMGDIFLRGIAGR